MPARTQELAIGIGFKKQTGTGLAAQTKTQLQTALSAGDLWSLPLNAYNVPFPQLNQEDDADFFGKGDEWVREIFPTSLGMAWEWPFHLTSQIWAQVIAFAVGAPTPTTPAAGAYQYVCSPMDPVVDGVNLPATTLVSGLRAGTAGEIYDMAMIGVICSGFTLRIQRGPGLQNTQLTSRWIGCGKFANNSNIVIPALTATTRLGAGALTSLIIGGVDYLANARIVDIEFSYENNAGGDSDYFPGSGQQSSYDLRGRMRYGKRSMNLTWSAELESNSTELADLVAGVESNTIIQIDGPIIASATPHRARIELARTRHKSIETVDASGFSAVRMSTDIMKSGSQPVAIFTAITNKQNIGVAA